MSSASSRRTEQYEIWIPRDPRSRKATHPVWIETWPTNNGKWSWRLLNTPQDGRISSFKPVGVTHSGYASEDAAVEAAALKLRREALANRERG